MPSIAARTRLSSSVKDLIVRPALLEVVMFAPEATLAAEVCNHVEADTVFVTSLATLDVPPFCS